ncbi:hypothetical protein O181_005365 [Austropuccinia psidii MF-1]|uniref:DUF1688 domain-containing protein n=1 Tax=Austropuccinia psidii MF-1 TaxID=1389203 RepID=A0A9Q3BI86_9BASI|nr:hypothetical protein [Austropuccinia psidii MF-1]
MDAPRMATRIGWLQSLDSIRATCRDVFELYQDDQLEFWRVNEPNLTPIIEFCSYLISRDYGTNYQSIPSHSRWRHFLANGQDRISPLLKQWSDEPSFDNIEIGRKMVDLFVVAVLMDAGAGNDWVFSEPIEDSPSTSDDSNLDLKPGIGRSEGLAIGTLHAFKRGIFSSDPQNPHQVTPQALLSLTTSTVADFMQSKPGNQIIGLEGRSALLQNLGRLLESNSCFFPCQPTHRQPRPGNLIDYILSHPAVKSHATESTTQKIVVPIDLLWEAVINHNSGLGSIWPKEGREAVDGEFIGDVWTCRSLKQVKGDQGYVSFHKLSQWLTYSLIEVLEKTLGWIITDQEKMTGLPEYRNGGLLIDFEYISPKPSAFALSESLSKAQSTSFDLLNSLPPLPASHPAIVEWRAITVIALDLIKEGINEKLGLTATSKALSLAQVLEAATWKGGREIAKIKRSQNGAMAGPPLKVISDGTVF